MKGLIHLKTLCVNSVIINFRGWSTLADTSKAHTVETSLNALNKTKRENVNCVQTHKCLECELEYGGKMISAVM